MDTVTVLKVLVGVGVPLLGFIGAYRRFRKSGTDEVESFSRYLTQGVKYYFGRFWRRKLAGELTLRQYARIHLRNTATEMMVPATYPVSLKTDDVFVPLLLRDASRATVEYHDLFERRRGRTVIVGEPGSGKSSLMKRTFRDACRRAIADPRHAPMPILFELRNLSRLEGEELQELTRSRLFKHCIQSLDDAAAFKTKRSIEDLQHAGGFLLLLDGLDEVPREASARVTEAITELGAHLSLKAPKSSMIVSTRTQHYLSMHDRSFQEAFQALQIRPFSIADVYRFLLNWPFEADRAKNIARLFSRIRQLPSLTEMCTNPLALSMFVARDQQTDGAVSPETRTEFYASLVDELLVNRRFRREDTPVGRQRLRRTRERILGGICLGHLLDPDETLNSITQERMLQQIEAAGYSAADAPTVLETLAIDTGLFSAEREGETYRFMHLTLCEFIAARAVVNRGSPAWTEISGRLSSQSGTKDADWGSRLAEVVAFASGLAPDSLGDVIVRDLTTHADDGLLLRAAIEAQDYANADVIHSVHHEANELAAVEPPGWNVAWFSRLRWLLAIQRDITASSHAELSGDALASVPTPAAYLIGLIDQHGAAERILATLSRADTDAALAIAEDSGRANLMDVVASAADDFGTLLGILARFEAGSEAWAHALVHCAIHERQIARVLFASREAIGPAPTERRWETSFITKGSVYGRLLDQVLKSPDGWRDEDVGLLARLARINPPQREALSTLRAAGAPAFLLPFLFLTMVAAIVTMARSSSETEFAGLLTPLVLLAGTFLIAVVLPRIRRMLRRLGDERMPVRVEMGSGVSIQLDSSTTGRLFTLPGPVRAGIPRARLSRVAVLEEILNLAQYRFGAAGPGPRSIARIFAGVTREDLRALGIARSLRRSEAL